MEVISNLLNHKCKDMNFFFEIGINMHPSLLPRHRGAAPIYHTILNGDKVGGISVIELHKSKFDAGRVCVVGGY